MSDLGIDATTIWYLLPEVWLVLTAVTIFLAGAFWPGKWRYTGLALLSLSLAAITLLRQTPLEMGTQPLNFDPFARLFRLFALVIGGLFVLILTQCRQKRLYSELLGGLLLVVTGLMLVAAAGDLVLIFLGLEMISIPTYMLLYVARNDPRSDEATAKYFFLSILSSAFLLYGFATLYGVTGQLQLSAMQGALLGESTQLASVLLPVGLVMTLCGLAFKIAAVPFHFYAPDVYQGTTNLNAALLAVVPKIAGTVALIRVLVGVLPPGTEAAWKIVIILSIASMTLGNVAALWQRDLRRMMGYSSIAHAGYLLIGLAAALDLFPGSSAASEAVTAMAFYVLVYAAATIGIFGALAYLSDDDVRFSQVEDLAGVGRAYPVIGVFMAVSLFSLSGIPPLAGFWGKLALFKSALDAGLGDVGGLTSGLLAKLSNAVPVETGSLNGWFLTLGIAGALNAAVAAAYYLRVVGALYFHESEADHSLNPVMGNTGAGLAAMLAVAMVIGIGVFTAPVFSRVRRGADAIWPPNASAAVSPSTRNTLADTQ